MSKILLVSTNTDKAKEFQDLLQRNSYEFLYSDTQLLTSDIMKTQRPDIVLLDTTSNELDFVAINKIVKSYDNVVTTLIVGGKKVEPELMKNSNSFLQEPLSNEILLASIQANLRTRQSLEKLANSNQELARSLYQLNVLYSTSSQLAGTLDKDKLIGILIDGMDKSLSFGLSCVLSFKSETEPVVIINSLYNVSDRLLEALKLRAILNYKSLFENSPMPFELDINNLKLEKHIKYPIKEYDFSVLRSDSLFAPINMGENFFGFIEIFREAEFTTEDTTCFQTLAQQVSLPLKSAALYEAKEKTNKKLERLERLKSEFISIVSHELRTPLTAIKNSMDIILSGKAGTLTEAMDKFIGMGRRNVVRLSGIINDLLDLSKIEAGKMDFQFDNIKIGGVVEYVKNNLEQMAKDKNLTLVTTLEDNFADIYADPRRLEQILTNLVSNAIKFTNEGGKIEIRTNVVDADEIRKVEKFNEIQDKLKGKFLQVMVKDNGIGIAPENLAHVFDKFAQIENSLSRKVGGSGLGLPIARQLLESHNGTIWCNSKPEKGSSFYFVIPISNDKNKFLIDFKQNLQKSKVSNSTLALIKIKSNKNIITEIKQNLKESYLKNSVIEDFENESHLTFSIIDADKYSVDFIKKRIEEHLTSIKVFNTCDIMFSYGIYPRDALDDYDLIKHVENNFQLVKITSKV